ncbi:MAG: inositol monophosphatase family protein [Asgard group archaeon]
MYSKVKTLELCRQIVEQIHEKIRLAKEKGVDLSEERGIGADKDATLAIDSIAEEVTLNVLKEKFKGMILTEEKGLVKLGEDEELIIIDPIDGTKNAARGYPFYAFSIACYTDLEGKDPYAGYINNLGNNDEFFAYKGKTYYNEKPTKTVHRELKEAGITLIRPTASEHMEMIDKIRKNCKFIRISGSAALDVAYIASGAMDGFIDFTRGLKTVDYAAAAYILQCAGGVITTLGGEKLPINKDLTKIVNVLATGSEELHKKLVNLLIK